jgi:hypothetical protein
VEEFIGPTAPACALGDGQATDLLQGGHPTPLFAGHSVFMSPMLVSIYKKINYSAQTLNLLARGPVFLI